LTSVSVSANFGALLYSIEYFNERVDVLSALVKKTQATPERDLRIARRRMKEVRDG
jgi:phage-related protein